MNDSLLIEKHLADGLTDEEAARLEAAVSHDPVAAGRLVAAARMDERLVVRLGPGRSELTVLAGLKRGRTASTWTTRWRRPLAMAAALVLALGLAAGLAAWRRSMREVAADAVAADSPRTTRPFVPAPVPITPDRADAPQRVETETPAMAALRRFLSSYYLTDLKLETARPLEEALERLLQRARELNHLKNPVIERLSAELAAAEPDGGREDTAVALPLKHLSLMDALRWVAALNRSEVFLKEPGVVTFRQWEPTDDETLVIEVVRVRPDLLTRPVAREDKSRGVEESAAADVDVDPFVGSTGAPAAPRLTPIELFQSWGIAFGGEASATYDEATAAMTIRHTASALRVIKELVGMGSGQSMAMVNVFTKVFEFPDARPLNDDLLTDERFQHWLREMNQTKGVNLLSAPQITIRSGQRGMIEIADTYEPGGDWRGLRLPVEAVLEGEIVKVVGAVELRLPVNRQPGQQLIPQGLAGGELATTATDFEVIVPPGQTAVFSANESPEGPHFAIAVTVVPVDSSGQRVGAPVEEPVEAAVPEETGGGGDDAR